MVATSRFVEFSSTGTTLITGVSTDSTCQGSRGLSRGTSLGSDTDKFSVVLNSNDQLAVNINGVGPFTITLASGTDLDPRFVARDMEYKLHSASGDDAFTHAQVNWRNGGGSTNNRSSFIIYTGELGSNGGANDVNVSSPGGRDARTLLGFNPPTEVAGADQPANTYTGACTVSGVFAGQFDDFYTLMISDGELIESGGSTGTYTGAITLDGIFVDTADDVYTITIDTTNGASMGAGTGNVPSFTVTDTPGTDDNANPIELLYVDHFYDVGDNGVRAKFSDAAFGNGDTFTVNAFTASGTGYPKAVAAAKYIWSSTRGDSSKTIGLAPITTQTTGTQVGTLGATISFSNSGTLDLGDTFEIFGRGPQPTNSDTTQLNFGNVTVSTNSPVKVVWFELISGAVSMSTVKFSLQADGTFQHHDQGDADTEFHYGTVGAGNSAPGAGPTTNSQNEFPVDSDGLGNVAATDIDSDSSPTTLFATKADLAVVASADNAETLGNFQGGVVSDLIYLAIKLGANETGANSTINYRMFFDFS